MHKAPLAAFAAAIITGCATAPEPPLKTYTYNSHQHSGTVYVTEKQIPAKVTCNPEWRDGEIYVPKGLPSAYESNLQLRVKAVTPGEAEKEITVSLPMSLGQKVVAADFQKSKTFMLGADKQGIVMQGDHFFYPDGYYIRVSNPQVRGNQLSACIGIDRMYVLGADLESGVNPPVYLDRVVVPYVAKAGETLTVTFGSQLLHRAEIRISPK